MFQKKNDLQRHYWENRSFGSVFSDCPFRFFILFLLLFYSFHSISQNQIGDVMNSMTDAKLPAATRLIPLKSSLPNLFFGSPISGYIGISDPGADSVTAKEQAFLRAASLYNLSNGIGRGLSDYYTKDDGQVVSNNYEELCELNANCRISASAFILSEPIYLQTGEVILLLNVDSSFAKNNDLMEFQSKVSLYSKETGSDNNMLLQSKSILETSYKAVGKPGGHHEKLNNVCINNLWMSRTTLYDDKLIDNSSYKLFYESNCNSDKAASTSGAESSTFEGLWYALINSTYHQLSMQLKQQFQKEKSVSENYNSNQSQLSRDSGFFTYKCMIESINFCDDALNVKIKTSFSSAK